ncbi:MAG: hypothetical protein IJJ40_03675 [Clostridia bacterium]|nr:hypothetical protein [Clostridia bacterium]
MKKIYSVILIIVLMIFSYTGCVSPLMKNYPTEQSKTTWTSKDKKVCFFIEGKNDFPIYGYIQLDTERIAIIIDMGVQVPLIEVYQREGFVIDGDNYEGKLLEMWTAKKVKKNSLTVSVDESTYFKKGETITFYRLDE